MSFDPLAEFARATTHVEQSLHEYVHLHTLNHELAMVIVAAFIGAALGLAMAIFHHLKSLARS